MAILLILHHHLWLSGFGILGNILSVFVFLAPVSTFIEIYMARSMMGFDSMPYILASFGCIMASSRKFVVSWFLPSDDEIRVSFVGWMSVAASITVFASPIDIVLDVLITRRVEFLKLYTSFFVALSATMWFGFGFMLRDMCILLSSIFAFLLGFIQSLLYVIYWELNPMIEENEYVPEHVMNIQMSGMVYPVNCGRNSSGADTETNSKATH